MKNASSWLAVIFFLGCMVLGCLVVRQKTEITQLNLRWSAAEKESQKRTLDLQHQVVDANRSLAAASKPAAPSSADSSASSPREGRNDGPVVVHIGDVLKDHPELASLYQKQVRRQINAIYGMTLNTLNLPPDQLAQLKDLLTERQMSNIDAQGAAAAAGLVQGTPEWRDAMKQAAQNVEQQIVGILGPNADGTLAQLQMRNSIQNAVTTFYAPDFADAGAALNPEQSAGLVQSMADANYTGKDMTTRPSNYNDPDPATGLSPHDDRIIASAAQVLTPAQLQVLKSDQIATEAQATAIKQYNPSGGPVRLVP